MSGWEDLVDEAAGDLGRLEARVAAAAERLIQLQVCAFVCVCCVCGARAVTALTPPHDTLSCPLQAGAMSAAEALHSRQREAERQEAAAAAAAVRAEVG
jgi:hypothetical protein